MESRWQITVRAKERISSTGQPPVGVGANQLAHCQSIGAGANQLAQGPSKPTRPLAQGPSWQVGEGAKLVNYGQRPVRTVGQVGQIASWCWCQVANLACWCKGQVGQLAQAPSWPVGKLESCHTGQFELLACWIQVGQLANWCMGQPICAGAK